MASWIRMAYDGYHELMDDRSDPRVRDWFLMSSPWPTVLMTLLYLYFVKAVGPKWMKDRTAFDLKNTMILYNALQAAFSMWLFNETICSGWLTHYSLKCQPVDYSNNPQAVRAATAYWWFYFSKLVDFLDTIFFVLRKKDSQITNLHLIHHSIMPTACWAGVKFLAGGHSTFLSMLNTFVHSVMYSYYLLAALGPQYQKYLWWKQYLTIMQMGQFVLVLIHACQLFFVDCDFPIIFAWWCLFAASLFFILFANYYIQAYLKPRKKDENFSVKEEARKWLMTQWLPCVLQEQLGLYSKSS